MLCQFSLALNRGRYVQASYYFAIMPLTLAERGEKLHPISIFLLEHFFYIDLCNYKSSVHLQEDFPNSRVS